MFLDFCMWCRVCMRSWWIGVIIRVLELSMCWLGWDVWMLWVFFVCFWCWRLISGCWRKFLERMRILVVLIVIFLWFFVLWFDLLIDLNNNFNVVLVICVFYDWSYYKFNLVRFCCRCSWIYDFEFFVSVMKWFDVVL